eukprot:3764013-Rhodomonas_salina.1
MCWGSWSSDFGLWRRWEDIFTQQMSSSMQAITDLNKKVVDLEEDLTHQAREKQLLRERVEQVRENAC